jgi:hypothetical protein
MMSVEHFYACGYIVIASQPDKTEGVNTGLLKSKMPADFLQIRDSAILFNV